MRVALISANLGRLCKRAQQHVPQTIPTVSYYFDDGNFPPRTLALHPRLQAKIPRMLAWEFLPGYDFYIWIDSTISLVSEDAVKFMVDELGDYPCAFFAHHDGRTSIREELNFMAQYNTNDYLKERYATEPLGAQVETYLQDPQFTDNNLYCTGMFIYRPDLTAKALLKEWYYHNARYSIQDQLSLPYVASKFPGAVKKITSENLLNNRYITHFWNSAEDEDALVETPYVVDLTKVWDEKTLLIKSAFDRISTADVECWGWEAPKQIKDFLYAVTLVDGNCPKYCDTFSDLRYYTPVRTTIVLDASIEGAYCYASILENAFYHPFVRTVFCVATKKNNLIVTKAITSNFSMRTVELEGGVLYICERKT